MLKARRKETTLIERVLNSQPNEVGGIAMS
jgi:hypothetical protein